MARPSRFSPEVRERAVRMVFEHTQDHASLWAAISSIAEKIGCAAETLRLSRGARAARGVAVGGDSGALRG